MLADTPPSSASPLGMFGHSLWALAVAIPTGGVVALLRDPEALRTGQAGYLATVVLGLGVLPGLQWVTQAYVDVRTARSGDHDLVLETVIEPLGAGHLRTYCLILRPPSHFWAGRSGGQGSHIDSWIGPPSCPVFTRLELRPSLTGIDSVAARTGTSRLTPRCSCSLCASCGRWYAVLTSLAERRPRRYGSSSCERGYSAAVRHLSESHRCRRR